MASQISFGNCNSGLQVGSSNAPITAHFHVKNERIEAPPHPLSTVPFRRDKDFVECGTIFDDINEKSRVPSPRIALVGLGGVGKSQLAIEYSYRIRERSRETWIFWVHASNAARFEQSFREIADRVKIPGRENPVNNIFQLVHDWLQDERNGKWILILDNVDDDRFLQEAPLVNKDAVGQESDQMLWRPLQTYLPQNTHGLILITTRNKGVALRMVEEREIIMVQPMDQLHAQKLFEVKLGMQDSTEDILQLAAALEYMPLALVQAAAYIKQRAPRSSVKHYLEQFQSSDNNKLSLLEYEKGQLRRDREAKNSIIRTWQISFDHLRQERPSAANLLSLMSFFNRQAIHESLLPIHNQETGDVTTQQVNVDNRENCLTDVEDPREEDFCTLRDYSFITVKADARSFAMHRLVQIATQKWLEEHGELEKWKKQFIRNIYEEYPFAGRPDAKNIDLTLPHIMTAVVQQKHPEHLLPYWVSILDEAVRYAWLKGHIVEAENIFEKATDARRMLNKYPMNEIYEKGWLGEMLENQGKYEEAEGLFREVHAEYQRLLGDNHPLTALSLTSICRMMLISKNRADTELMCRREIAECEKIFGPYAFSAISGYAHLGQALVHRGKFEDAQAILEDALAEYKKTCDLSRPNFWGIFNALSVSLSGQGKHQEAEEIYNQILRGKMQELGPNSPNTLASLSVLGSMLTAQGKNSEAEAILRKTLETLHKILGSEHPTTASCAANLAMACYHQGRFEECELLLRQVLAAREKKLGSHHIETAFAMAHLAVTVGFQNRRAEALELATPALKILWEQLGPEDPYINDIRTGLAQALNGSHQRRKRFRSTMICKTM